MLPAGFFWVHSITIARKDCLPDLETPPSARAFRSSPHCRSVWWKQPRAYASKFCR